MTDTWRGRFRQNEISSLLEVNRKFNLAESTSQDMRFGELLDLVGLENVSDLELGYGSHRGTNLLCEEVASLCGVPAEQVIATQGTALAIYLLAVELCRPGDEVVLFTPCFPPSRDALLGCDVHVREIPLTFEDGYQVDVGVLEKALTKQTRMISLATPQNPSGVIIDRQTVDQILDVMNKVAPQAYLFLDETYRDATFGDKQAPESFAGHHHRIITGSSISKAYGVPGLRVGWMTTQDADLRARLMVAKMNIVISGSPLTENLAGLLLANRHAALAPQRENLKSALAVLTQWHQREAHRLALFQPDGGALCCMKLSKDVFDDASVEQFWKVLPSFDLQLAPGGWFGESNRIFRLGFGYIAIKKLPDALSALTKAMDACAKLREST